MRKRMMPVMAGVLFSVLSLEAASLTTTFVSNNARRGNMFDIQVNNDLTVESFDINLASGLTMEIFVYYRAGGYSGAEYNAGAWTLAGSQVVASNGSDVATPVDIADFVLNAGLYGLFVTTDGTTSSAIRYTNGTTSYSNADLTIYSGLGTAVPFVDAGIADRVWNGTIHYKLNGSAVPEPAVSGLVVAGLAAMAALGRRRRAQ